MKRSLRIVATFLSALLVLFVGLVCGARVGEANRFRVGPFRTYALAAHQYVTGSRSEAEAAVRAHLKYLEDSRYQDPLNLVWHAERSLFLMMLATLTIDPGDTNGTVRLVQAAEAECKLSQRPACDAHELLRVLSRRDRKNPWIEQLQASPALPSASAGQPSEP